MLAQAGILGGVPEEFVLLLVGLAAARRESAADEIGDALGDRAEEFSGGLPWILDEMRFDVTWLGLL